MVRQAGHQGPDFAGDVQRAEQAGADVVILSNHGGRQLDGTAPPLMALPEAEKVKKAMALMLDSGVRIWRCIGQSRLAQGQVAPQPLARGRRRDAIGRCCD